MYIKRRGIAVSTQIEEIRLSCDTFVFKPLIIDFEIFTNNPNGFLHAKFKNVTSI